MPPRCFLLSHIHFFSSILCAVTQVLTLIWTLPTKSAAKLIVSKTWVSPQLSCMASCTSLPQELFSHNCREMYLVQREFKLNLGLYFPVLLSPSIYINSSRLVLAQSLLTARHSFSPPCIEQIWCSLGLQLFICSIFPSELEVLENNCLYYP